MKKMIYPPLKQLLQQMEAISRHQRQNKFEQTLEKNTTKSKTKGKSRKKKGNNEDHSTTHTIHKVIPLFSGDVLSGISDSEHYFVFVTCVCWVKEPGGK